MKQLLTLAMMISLFASCTQSPSVPKEMFLIRGSLTNVPDSTIIELFHDKGAMATFICQDTVINGQFELRDSISEGLRLALFANGEGMQAMKEGLYIAPGRYILIEGDGGVMKGWSYRSNYPKQNEYRRFVEAGLPEAFEVAKNSIEYGRYSKKIVDMKSYREYKPIVDSINKLNDPLELARDMKQLEHLKESEMTELWHECFYDFARSLVHDSDSTKIALVKEIYGKIPQSYLDTEKGKVLTSKIFPPMIAEVGDKMVDSKLYDIAGEEHSLAEFSGKYILLDFWSRGCGPCVASFPESERVAEKYADKLRIVSISSDDKKMWSDYVTTKDLKGYHWNELSEIQYLYNSYGFKGVPSYVMISPEGVVISKWSGYGKDYLMKRVSDILD